MKARKKRPLKAVPVVVPSRLAPLKDGDEVSLRYEGGKYKAQRVRRKR